MEGTLYDADIGMATVECCKCGIIFGMTRKYRTQLQETKDTFYCPSGHGQVFCKTRVSELEADIASVKASHAFLTERLAESRKEARRHLTERKKLRTKMSKLKTRISNGVCPCCQRTFGNLARHMQTKHPQYPLPAPEPEDLTFSHSASSSSFGRDKQGMAASAEQGTAPKPVQVNAGANVRQPSSGQPRGA